MAELLLLQQLQDEVPQLDLPGARGRLGFVGPVGEGQAWGGEGSQRRPTTPRGLLWGAAGTPGRGSPGIQALPAAEMAGTPLAKQLQCMVHSQGVRAASGPWGEIVLLAGRERRQGRRK